MTAAIVAELDATRPLLREAVVAQPSCRGVVDATGTAIAVEMHANRHLAQTRHHGLRQGGRDFPELGAQQRQNLFAQLCLGEQFFLHQHRPAFNRARFIGKRGRLVAWGGCGSGEGEQQKGKQREATQHAASLRGAGIVQG